ncbi:Histone-lysine N-methyltransferase SETMAR-like [Aphelenchoides besseyi]|nr:Histone-lysine N-methyltransferase SETMAR-like [Aphelenchoides besseyi]KAI6219238.1 Histone-lysine N-methyltransferase SETMAR-like [Aphelenchoides besseyi]
MAYGMTSKLVHLRHCLLFLFDQGLTAKEAYKELRRVYGPRVPKGPTISRWFAKFRGGDRTLFRLKRSDPTDVKLPLPARSQVDWDDETNVNVITIKDSPHSDASIIELDIKEEEDDY